MNSHTAIHPTPEQITVCAYLIWEKEGRPLGRQKSHWLQAEKQLKADCTQEAGLLRCPNPAAPAEPAAAEQPLPKRRNNSKHLEVVAS
jgi:hypothetical protein